MSDPRITRDRNEIETWADNHNAVPVREGDEIRLVHEDQVTTDHDRLEWEAFHREVDEGNHVVTYYGDEGDREPFEVGRRDSALERVDMDREEAEERLIEGETITGTITETTVVEETIVEETTIESEVVDEETVDVSVVDVELLNRECNSCDVTTEDTGFDYVGTYGTDRYLADDLETGPQTYDEYPFDVTVEITEDWAVTLEQHDRYTVETDITDVDVTATDEVEAHDRQADIDIETIHRQLLGSGGVDIDIDVHEDHQEGDIVDTETYDIESEVTNDEILTTYLDSREQFEREITERTRLTADVIEGELLDREVVAERALESGTAGRDVSETTTGVEETTTEVEETTTEVEETSTAMGTDEEIRLIPEDRDEGKPVVNARGDKVGEIADVSEGVAYVDPHPSLGSKVMAKLGMDEDDDYYLIDEDAIEVITDDEVEVSPGVVDELKDDETR